MAKQIPSLMLYLPQAGPQLFINMLKMADPSGGFKRARDAYKFVTEHDPQVAERQLEREMVELKNAKGNAYTQYKSFIAKYGMWGIYAMDRTAITIGWKAVYDNNVARLGHEQAVKLARDVTLRTQPQAAAKDLPGIYASSEYLNWVLQFTNQLNQIYNLGKHDIRSMVKSGEYGIAMAQAGALAMTALWIATIKKGELPDDAEDVLDAFFDQFIASLPLFGRELLASMEGIYSGGDVAITKAVKQITSFLKRKNPRRSRRRRRSRSGDNKTVKRIAEGVGIITAFPGIFTERTWEFLESEGEINKLIPTEKSRKKRRRRRR
jgi:hypothetical protein